MGRLHEHIGGSAMAGLSRRDFLLRSGLIVAGLTGGSSLLSACAGGGGGGTGPGGGGGPQLHPGSCCGAISSPAMTRGSTRSPRNGARRTASRSSSTTSTRRRSPPGPPPRSGGQGHDLIEWHHPASAYEPSVHDMTDVVKEAGERYGSQIELLQAAQLQPHDQQVLRLLPHLDARPGRLPQVAVEHGRACPTARSTYDELLTGRRGDHQEQDVRMGIGMSARGGLQHGRPRRSSGPWRRIQDANEKVVLNSPETVAGRRVHGEAVQAGDDRRGVQLDRRLQQPGPDRGRALLHPQLDLGLPHRAGRPSASVADDIFFTPALKGPTGTGLASQHVVRNYIDPEVGEEHRQGQEVPAGPGRSGAGVGDSSPSSTTSRRSPTPPRRRRCPAGCRTTRSTPTRPTSCPCWPVRSRWSTNVGHPGPANPAVGEIFDTNVIPTMMADVARGKAGRAGRRAAGGPAVRGGLLQVAQQGPGGWRLLTDPTSRRPIRKRT